MLHDAYHELILTFVGSRVEERPVVSTGSGNCDGGFGVEASPLLRRDGVLSVVVYIGLRGSQSAGVKIIYLSRKVISDVSGISW